MFRSNVFLILSTIVMGVVIAAAVVWSQDDANEIASSVSVPAGAATADQDGDPGDDTANGSGRFDADDPDDDPSGTTTTSSTIPSADDPSAETAPTGDTASDDPGDGGTTTTSTTTGDDAEGETGTDDSAPNDPPPAPTAPTFKRFFVSDVEVCKSVNDPSFEEVTVSWHIEGADSVYLAIDNEFGPYETDLPAKAELVVPGPGCSEPNTYYVVAENSVGRTVKQATRTAVPADEPAADQPPAEEDPEPTAPPTVKAFSVAEVAPCMPGRPQPGPVTVTWKVEGADTVYIAIDNPSGPYESNMAHAGTIDVPGPGCDDANTYFLVAENTAGSVVKQATRTG